MPISIKVASPNEKQYEYRLGTHRENVGRLSEGSILNDTDRQLLEDVWNADDIPNRPGIWVKLRRLSAAQHAQLPDIIANSRMTSSTLRNEIAKYIAEFSEITKGGGEPFSSARDMMLYLPMPLVLDLQLELMRPADVTVGNG